MKKSVIPYENKYYYLVLLNVKVRYKQLKKILITIFSKKLKVYSTKLIIQGDLSQCDKYGENYTKSGFYDIWNRLKEVSGVKLRVRHLIQLLFTGKSWDIFFQSNKFYKY